MNWRCLVIGSVTFLLAAGDANDAVKKELARFEGTWKFVSIETEKEKIPEEALKHPRLKIMGNKFTVMEDENNSFGGTLKLDPTKKPKTIDVTFTDGKDKGKTSLGIYELEGDNFKVCVDPEGKTRPMEFAVKAGSGYFLEILKREKK
jgi:uncharacterized protein (TIGR03067 family)